MTKQDISRVIVLTLNDLNLNYDDKQGIEYQGIILMNPKTKKNSTVEEITSELLEIIDYDKIESITEFDLQNLIKSFLDLKMHITKLYFSYNK